MSEIVRRCEELHPETCQRFREIQIEDYKIFCSKQLDYGPTNITGGEDINNEDGNNKALYGVAVRINDKVSRLKNLLWPKVGKSKINNESIEDSLMDLSNYGIIARLVKEKTWSK